MNYEKKYKEALKWMQSLYSGLHGATKEEAEKYFPELKESDYEKVKRIIYSIVTKMSFHVHDIFTEEEFQCFDAWCHTWLEKQGKKSTNIDIDKMVMEYSQTKDGDFGLPVNCMIRAYRKGINDTLCIALKLEKQGGQEHFYDFNANDWYVSKVDGKIHNMTYDPSDNVKPKFKVGDWITNGDYTWKIVEVKPLHYILQSQDGNIVDDTISYVDEQFHSFTIKDAKNGDVLAFDDDTVVIFKDLYNSTTFHSYCHIEDDIFDISKDDMPDWWEGKGFQPATKEQRDLLFQKMKEAGYEWDSDKKELKKIESKTLDADKKVDRVIGTADHIKTALDVLNKKGAEK